MNRPSTHARNERPDPLTDSAIHRIALGTQVRLHVYSGWVDCGLLDVVGVTTWGDLVLMIHLGRPIEVRGEQRCAFAGGVVLWAECTRDPD